MKALLLNGFVLGWSVAWPPGPVNAEMIRRGLLPREQGGGFWATWRVGLGACSAGVRVFLGVTSLALLLFLAGFFSFTAWKTARRQNAEHSNSISPSTIAGNRRGGYLLGFIFAVSSPWNIGFWLAVVGSQQTSARAPSFLNSLILACAVVFGAVTWTIVLCLAVRSGARIFVRPMWQVWTEMLTAAVMLYFAVKLALQLFA
jgi:threonine/homoserine/homoserine lactone efflux protein